LLTIERLRTNAAAANLGASEHIATCCTSRRRPKGAWMMRSPPDGFGMRSYGTGSGLAARPKRAGIDTRNRRARCAVLKMAAPPRVSSSAP
jgi:hypothetical protein